MYYYLDDLIVYKHTPAEHDKNLEAVLSKLKKAGLVVNDSTCHFRKPSLQLLGHVMTKNCICPDQEHIDAVLKAPAPSDTATLRSSFCHGSAAPARPCCGGVSPPSCGPWRVPLSLASTPDPGFHQCIPVPDPVVRNLLKEVPAGSLFSLAVYGVELSPCPRSLSCVPEDFCLELLFPGHNASRLAPGLAVHNCGLESFRRSLFFEFVFPSSYVFFFLTEHFVLTSQLALIKSFFIHPPCVCVWVHLD